MRSRRWLHASGGTRPGGITALRVRRVGIRRERSVWWILGQGRRGSGGGEGEMQVVAEMGMGKKRKDGGREWSRSLGVWSWIIRGV